MLVAVEEHPYPTKLTPSSHRGGGRDGAEVAHSRRARTVVNLRRALRVDAWNIVSLSDDHRLPCLSDELRRLRVDMMGLSGVRRIGSGETSSGGYMYYSSGRGDGVNLGGVAVGISSHLQSHVIGVTPADEGVMLERLKHTLGFISHPRPWLHQLR